MLSPEAIWASADPLGRAHECPALLEVDVLLPSPDVLPTPGPTAGHESGWDRRDIILEEPLLFSGSRPEGVAPPFIDLPRDVLYKAFREPTSQGQGKVRPTLALVAITPAKLELRSPTRGGPSHPSAPR